MTAQSFDAPPSAISDLRRALQGPVLTAEDAGYDQARQVFFTGFDRRPAAIAQVESAADVAAALGVARSAGLPISVRSGGHSVAGHGVADGAVVIDLSRLRALDIDAENRIARAQTGLTAGEFTSAAQALGLATGFGDTPSVGIGGITLAGGIGLLVRKLGLTIDSLAGAEVVTADGEVLQVDAENHPDLFWALRGAGSNFGVVTRLDLRLHEVKDVYGGMLMLPAEPRVVAGIVAAGEEADEALSMIVNVAKAPPLPFIPAELHGSPIALIFGVYAGDAAAGEAAFKPFRALADPLVDAVQPTTYAALFEEEGGPPAPAALAIRSMFMDGFGLDEAELVLERLATSTAPMAMTQLRVLGGAVARVPDDATAFAHRQRRLTVNVGAGFNTSADVAEGESWVTQLAADLSGTGAYVGFFGDEAPERVRAAYPGATYERLAAIKATYDPDNVFRSNVNIPPAG